MENLFRNFGGNVKQNRSAECPVEVTLHEAYQGGTRLIDLSDGRRLEVKIPPASTTAPGSTSLPARAARAAFT